LQLLYGRRKRGLKYTSSSLVVCHSIVDSWRGK